MSLEVMTAEASDRRVTFAVQKPSGETYTFDVIATEAGIEIGPVRQAGFPVAYPRTDRIGSDGWIDR